MDNLSGQEIKGYALKERIATGGFGAVYRAQQSTVGREVAVKVILPGLSNQPDFIRRIEAEAQLIARLEHHFIVPLYDYWRDPDGAYLVMRYLRGGSLHDYIRRHGASRIEDAVNMFSQVAQGLHVAHRNQVIHRDIKPGNILLDEDGTSFLADFGIAKDHTASLNITEPDSFIGSPEYLAPEQARSEPITPQTDIYSLGVVLFEMLTGEHPFPSLEKIEVIFKHLNEPLPNITTLDEHICDDVNAVIQKATAKDPKRRFSDVIEMMEALRQAAQLDLISTPTSPVELLTPREQEVMQLIIDGKTNRQIADILVLTEGTVKTYITRIYRKLNVRSRVQAIARLRDLNFVIQKPKTSITRNTDQLPEPDNPYKGLRAFQAADAPDYFGREKLTQKVLSRLQQSDEFQRFLALVGPSGSGKSSLAKAGVIPALWRGDIPSSNHWYIVEMLPGAHPLDELEVALLQVVVDNNINLREQLERDNRGLVRVANLILPDEDSDLLLVIDQFEEVFTLLKDDAERRHLLNLIHTAVTDARSRVRVLVTLRADYYDRPLHYPNFGELMRNRVETVLPLSAEELERAIRSPATRAGVIFEEGLVTRIVSDVHYEPGALPLLQYALTELFEHRDGRQLTLEAYASIGGTGGALAKRADEIYLETDDNTQDAIRQMFLRLVTLGEGAEDTRRRVHRVELLDITSQPDVMEEIIDTYAESRLLSLDHDLASRQPTVEVAHEAILREWERLREWLNESRDDIRQERMVAQAAKSWQEHGRDKSYLLTGTRLEQASAWGEQTQLALTPLETTFIESSKQEATMLAHTETVRAKREQAQEQRSRTLLRAIVAVFALATVFSGGFGIFAINSANAEAEARQDALTQASVGLAALADRTTDSDLSVLLALEAVEQFPFTSEAVGSLALAVDEYRGSRTLVPAEAINNTIVLARLSPSGEKVAGSLRLSENSLLIMDVESGDSLVTVNTHGELCSEDDYFIQDLEWSPSGNRIATLARGISSEEDCGLVVSDTTSGDTLLTLTDFDSLSISLGWSPDESTLVTTHEDGGIIFWNAQTGKEQDRLVGHFAPVHDVAFSPDGRLIASASQDKTIRLWNVDNGNEVNEILSHVGAIRSIAWSPDGAYVASAGDDALIRVWETNTWETTAMLRGHTQPILDVTWSSDGQRIASHSIDSTAKVWDAVSGGLLFEIEGVVANPTAKLGYVQFTPDNSLLLVGGARATGPQLWDTSIPYPILFGHSFGQEWGAWSPDGAYIATSGSDGSARLWDANTGENITTFNEGSFWSDWSSDGTHLVFAEGIGADALNIWDVTSGEMISRLTVKPDEYGSHHLLTMAWSPNTKMVVAADLRIGVSQPSFVWDVDSQELISIFDSGDTCHQGWPSWSPDNSRIVTGCIFVPPDEPAPAFVWDATTGAELFRLESDYGWTFATEWSPDGTQILTTHSESAAVVWDVDTATPIVTFSEHLGWVVEGSWSPDGELIATADNSSQVVRVWNAQTAEELMSFNVPYLVLTISWSPDGSHVIATGDGLIEPVIKRIWRSTEELIAHAYACCITRDLTPEERNQFGLPQR